MTDEFKFFNMSKITCKSCEHYNCKNGWFECHYHNRESAIYRYDYNEGKAIRMLFLFCPLKEGGMND